jgi:hypothetical protein
VLTDPERKERLILAGSDRADHFSMSRLAALYEGLYLEAGASLS